MNPWFGKVLMLVSIVSTVIIRAPHGGRSRKVAIVESQSSPRSFRLPITHCIPLRSQSGLSSFVQEFGSFIAHTQISAGTGRSAWRYVKITSWSHRRSIVLFDTPAALMMRPTSSARHPDVDVGNWLVRKVGRASV